MLNALADYEQKDQFDLVFIDSSFLSYKAVAAGIVWPKPEGAIAEGIANLIISDEYAPVNDLPIYLNKPLIVSHCNNDNLIAPKLGKEVFNKLISDDKSWLLLENCSHAQGFKESHPVNRQRLVNLLK